MNKIESRVIKLEKKIGIGAKPKTLQEMLIAFNNGEFSDWRHITVAIELKNGDPNKLYKAFPTELADFFVNCLKIFLDNIDSIYKMKPPSLEKMTDEDKIIECLKIIPFNKDR